MKIFSALILLGLSLSQFGYASTPNVECTANQGNQKLFTTFPQFDNPHPSIVTLSDESGKMRKLLFKISFRDNLIQAKITEETKISEARILADNEIELLGDRPVTFAAGSNTSFWLSCRRTPASL